MARSKLDEHRLREVDVERPQGRRQARARPVRRRARPHDALDPGRLGRRAHVRARHDARHRRLQVRPDPGRRDPGRRRRASPQLGTEELLLLCGDSTNADRPGFSPSEAIVGPRLEELFMRCQGRIVVTCFASNIHRVQQVVDAAAALDRKVSLIGRSMRKNVNIGRSLGHIEVPEGLMVPPRELDDWADERLVIISTGSQGEPLSALRRMAHRDHPQVELHEGDTVVFSAHADPGQRARRQRDDRPALPHRLRRHHDARRPDPRLRPRLRGGAQAHAQPRAPALRDAGPRRPQAHPPARPARRGGRRPPATGSSSARTACRWRSTSAARGSASAERSGMIFVDGVDIGDPTDVALRDRRMLSRRRHLHRRRDDLRAGRLVGRRARGHLPRRAVPRRGRAPAGDIRDTVEASLARAAEEEIRETDLLQKILHDDLAEFVYDRLRRRPMVLPVVVEV